MAYMAYEVRPCHTPGIVPSITENETEELYWVVSGRSDESRRAMIHAAAAAVTWMLASTRLSWWW
jgi:hypothetical protein